MYRGSANSNTPNHVVRTRDVQPTVVQRARREAVPCSEHCNVSQHPPTHSSSWSVETMMKRHPRGNQQAYIFPLLLSLPRSRTRHALFSRSLVIIKSEYSAVPHWQYGVQA
eukprot:201098-Rhodomonas_salina.1